MLITLLSWIEMFFCFLGSGFLFLFLIEKTNVVSEKTISELGVMHCLLMGAVFLTSYTTIYSFFSPINLHAHIFMLIVSIGAICIFREYRNLFFNKIKDLIKGGSFIQICLFIVLSLLLLYIACREENVVLDQNLYHGQTIRWLEEYGTVAGVGNLIGRIPFNSSFLTLQSLFSYSFIDGHSLHTLNGFFYYIFTWYALINLMHRCKNKRIARVVIWLGVIVFNGSYGYLWVNSTCTDYLITVVVLFVFSELFEYRMISEKSVCREKIYVMCYFVAWVVTLKLSHAPIILMVLYPLVMLLKEKCYDIIVKNIIVVAFILLPWMIRTVILSGYILYPVAGVDLFDFAWKMNRSSVENQAYWIHFGAYDNGSIPMSSIWLFIFCLGVIGIELFRIIKVRDDIFNYYLILTFLVDIVMWFTSAPSYRFNLGVIITIIGVGAEELGMWISLHWDSKDKIDKWLQSMISIVCFMTLAAQLVSLGVKYHAKTTSPLVFPVEYERINAVQVQNNGITFYGPDANGVVGYYAFPGVELEETLEHFQLIGDDIREGFRYVQ